MLKINWIKKITQNKFFRHCFHLGTGLPKVSFLFKCNLNRKDAAHYCHKDNFWSHIFLHWCDLNYREHIEDLDEILEQPLWFNSNIRINNLPATHQNLNDGPIFLKDIINLGNKRFLKYDDLVQKYPNNKLSWLDYQSMISAIPLLLKRHIQTDADLDSDNSHLYDEIIQKPKIANAVYHKIIDDDKHLAIYRNRWYANTNLILEPNEFKFGFIALYHHSKTVKLHNFQYRLLLGKIPTNVDLYKWKKKDSPMCTFVNLQKKPWYIYYLNVPTALLCGNISRKLTQTLS